MAFEYGQAKHFSLDDIATFGRAFRKTGKTVNLVVLGNGLHAGHISLIRTARTLGVSVVALAAEAFNDPEVKERLCAEQVDAVVSYGGDDPLYPVGMRTQVLPPMGLEDQTALSRELTRHISLINAVSPTVCVAGEKDYEFLVRLQQAVTDLRLPVRVQGVPTVRTRDGLPVSLRNGEIAPDEREKAVALSAALTAGAHVAQDGAQRVIEVAGSVIEAAGVSPEYLEVRGLDFGPPAGTGMARLLVAAHIGGVRVIDNVGVPIGIGFRDLAENS